MARINACQLSMESGVNPWKCDVFETMLRLLRSSDGIETQEIFSERITMQRTRF